MAYKQLRDQNKRLKKLAKDNVKDMCIILEMLEKADDIIVEARKIKVSSLKKSAGLSKCNKLLRRAESVQKGLEGHLL